MRMFVLLGVFMLPGAADAQTRINYFDVSPRVVERTCVVNARGVKRCTRVDTSAAATVGWTGPRGNPFSVTFGGTPTVTRTVRPAPQPPPAPVLIVPVQRQAVVVAQRPPRAQHPCPNARRSAAARARTITVRR